MTFAPRTIPGLDPEAQRALCQVQEEIARECKKLRDRGASPRRRVTELVEEGQVIAKPGEVVRVQPGDEDVTVYLPEPGPENGGEDIVVAFEGPGTAAGKVLVAPLNGTCALPAIQTLNAPGQYRFTSTGGSAPKAVASRWTDPATAAAGSPSAGTWSPPPPVTVDDLPPIDTDSLVENAVDNTILDDMPANSVKVNATGSAGNPTDLAIPAAPSVLGRRSSAGNIQAIRADEFVPSFYPTMANMVLRTTGTGVSPTFCFWGRMSANMLPDVAEGDFYLRATSGVGPPDARHLASLAGLGLSAILSPNYNINVNGSTSVVVDFPGTNQVQRAALTGDITAAQNSNATAFRTFSPLSVLGRSAGTSGVPTEIAATVSSEAVLHEALGSIAWGQVTTGGYADGSITDPKITNRTALSVWGRSANSSGPIADINTTAGSNAVLRESGGAIGWGTVATAGIADDAITNVKLANMAARTIRGRADAAGTGDPQDLTGLQTGAIIRFDNGVADTTSSGALTSYAVASGTNSITFNGVTVTLHGIQAPTERGQLLWIRHIGAGSCSIVQESSSAGAATERLALGDNITANTTGLILGSAGGTFNRSAMFMYTGSRWQRMDESIGEGFVCTQQIANDAVTDAKLRNSGALSVIGRSANSSGDPADISGTASSDQVLRISGTTLGFGQVATAGIADDAVTAAKMANMAERRIRGRADSAGTGDPQDLTGIQTGAIIRFGNQVSDAATTGTVATLTVAASTNQITFNSVSPVIHGINVPSEIGQLLIIQHIGSGSTSFVHESSTAGATGQRLRLGPYAANTTALTISQNQTAVFTYDNRWVWLGSASAAFDGDKGDITVSSGGTVWTIDNNTISDAKLRDSGALSVIGRSANSSGDPADISASASSDAVLRVSGTTLGFGTVATAGHADDSITDAKLRNSAACSVIGRSANTTGDPGDIAALTNDRVFVRRSNTLTFDQIVTADIADGVVTVAKLAGIGANTILGNDTVGTLTPNAIAVGTNTVVGRVAGNIVAAQLATGQIAANAVTDAKLRQSAALSVIGRSANSTGDVADISGTASSDAVLRVSGTTLGFGTVATAGIANDAITDAKLRNSAALSVIGRLSNSSGDPGDITAVSGSDNALREVGGTLGFGTLATGAYSNNSVTNAKLAQMAQSTIKGRAAGAGTGDPTDLTAGQVFSMIETNIEGGTLDFTGTNSFAGTTTFSGNVTVNQRLLLFGTQTLSPSSSQNDMSVSSSVTVVRMDPSNHIFVTGIVPAADGHFLLLINVSSSFNITLVHESASSSAANRFSIMDNGSASDGLHLRSRGGSCVLWYDGFSDRWRPLSMWNLITVSGGPA